MKTYCALLVLTAIFFCNADLHLPADFKRCSISDIANSDCLKEAIQDALPKLEKGIPELHFPSTQPLMIPSMTIGEGTGTVHVVQKFSNVKLYNLINGKLSRVVGHKTENGYRVEGDAYNNEIVLEADYDINGRVLVLPIVGSGKCTIKIKGLNATIDFLAEKFEKKGKTYLDVKEFKLTLNPNKMEYDFQNLFNGDERLGKEMNNVLNENWKDVFGDVKAEYEEVFSEIFKNLANAIFRRVPTKNIFLNPNSDA